MGTVVFFLLAIVATLAQVNGPLDGYYVSSNQDCEIHLDMRYLNFMSYAFCSNSNEPMMQLGVYDIQPSDPDAEAGSLVITYTTSLGREAPVPGSTVSFYWLKVASGAFNLSSPFFGGLEETFKPVKPSVLDGTWVWNQVMNGASLLVVAEMYYDTFTLLVLDQNDTADAVPLIGSFGAGDNKLGLSFAYGPANLVGTSSNGTYVVAQTLSINIYIPPLMQSWQLKNGARARTVSLWEGLWRGSTIFPNGASCMTTVEFRNNMWRGYQYECSTSPSVGFSFGSYIGPFTVSGNTLVLTYGFVDVNGEGGVPGLTGSSIPFTVTPSVVGPMRRVSLLGHGTMGNAPTIDLARISS